MIPSLIIKFGKKILLAAILVAIIVAVFIINPWNMFGGGLKMHQTTNNISAIREIGELITAEYYGETISTINQSRLRMIYADDVNTQADVIYRQIKQDLLGLYFQELEKIDSTKNEKVFRLIRFRRKKKESKEAIKNINEELTDTTYTNNAALYANIIEYIWMCQTNLEKKPKKKFSNKNKNTALWLLYQDVTFSAENLSDKELDIYIKRGLPEFNNQIFSDFYYQKKKDGISNKEKRKELSMIGRGWVKAGFNFEKLDEGNFLFDKDAGIVHLFGVQAEILNADINPWFIPERKIPGFQIIESNGKVDFYDAVEVKRYCVEKLRRMALEAGILEQAEIQGKEALKSFIGLLSGVEIKEVYFHYDPFSVYTKEILSDEFISYDESRILDTLIKNQLDTIYKLENAKTNFTENQNIKEIKIHQLQTAIKQMKHCWFEEKGNYYNRFSSLVYRVTTDSIISYAEYKDIKKHKHKAGIVLSKERTSKDSSVYMDQLGINVWFNDKIEYMVGYNKAIQTIFEKTRLYADVKDTAFSSLDSFLVCRKKASNNKYKLEGTDTVWDNIITEKAYESAYVLSYIKDSASRNTLLELIYEGKPEFWNNYLDTCDFTELLLPKYDRKDSVYNFKINDKNILTSYLGSNILTGSCLCLSLNLFDKKDCFVDSIYDFNSSIRINDSTADSVELYFYFSKLNEYCCQLREENSVTSDTIIIDTLKRAVNKDKIVYYFDSIRTSNPQNFTLKLVLSDNDTISSEVIKGLDVFKMPGTSSWNQNEVFVMNYLLNKYWKKYNVGFFTEANNKIKEILGQKKIQKNIDIKRREIKEYFNLK